MRTNFRQEVHLPHFMPTGRGRSKRRTGKCGTVVVMLAVLYTTQTAVFRWHLVLTRDFQCHGNNVLCIHFVVVMTTNGWRPWHVRPLQGRHSFTDWWSPYVIGQTIIFLPCDFYLLSSFFLSSPNLSRRELDVYHTSTHGVALVRI